MLPKAAPSTAANAHLTPLHAACPNLVRSDATQAERPEMHFMATSVAQDTECWGGGALLLPLLAAALRPMGVD